MTVMALLAFLAIANMAADNKKNSVMEKIKVEKAIFAAGCFWGVELEFSNMDGVVSTRVGYTGGTLKNPTYDDVCSGQTGHAEAIEIVFDSSKVNYEQLLQAFFQLHDPTTKDRQGPDIGSQYRSAVFYTNQKQKEEAEKFINKLTSEKKSSRPIVTEITDASEFYEAEEYHQKYLEKRGRSSCGLK